MTAYCVHHGGPLLRRAKSAPNLLACQIDGCVTWVFAHEGVVLIWVDGYGCAPLAPLYGGRVAVEAG